MWTRECEWCASKAYNKEKMIHNINCPLKVISEEKIGLDYKLTYNYGSIVSGLWLFVVAIAWFVYLCIAIPIWLVLFMLGRVH